MQTSYSFSPVGDQALLLTFGQAVDMALDADANARVMALYQDLKGQAPVWLRDMVPSLRALLIYYDAREIGYAELCTLIERELSALGQHQGGEGGRQLCLPVCYDEEFALDLASVADSKGLSPEAVLAKHQASQFKVYMLGFMPGAPYLGGLDPDLSLPRRASPRAVVPAGSVAIASTMGVIYPKQSPGGWHVLGRCPLPLFDPGNDTAPCLLAPGDFIRFQAISRPDYEALLADPSGYEVLDAQDIQDIRAGQGAA